MKHINLYQAAFHPPRTILPARKLLAGGALFLCGLLALYAWDAWRLTQLRRDVRQLQDMATRLEARARAGGGVRQADPRVQAEAESVEARLRNLQLAQDALAGGALGSETGYSAQFRALARARVPGAWLTRVEISERGHEMNLNGRALTGEDSARLIASLRREPLFVGLSFAGLTLATPEGKAKPVLSGVEGEAADTRASGSPPPPRFLEFALSARLNQVPPGASAQPGGSPAAKKPDATTRNAQ